MISVLWSFFGVSIGEFASRKGYGCGGQNVGGAFLGGLRRGLEDCGGVSDVGGAFGVKAVKNG